VGIDDEREPAAPGPANPDLAEPRPAPPGDSLLGVRNRAIAAIVFAVLYGVTFGTRGSLLPALVSAVLGGLVVFLLLREVDERRRRRR
jgi:Flp pilus assembly protein TadB